MDLPVVIREKLIEDLFQSLTEIEPWQSFFETLREWLSASKVFVIIPGDGGGYDMPFHLGWANDFPRLYGDEWSDRDSLLHACLAKLRATGGDWAGSRESLLDEGTFRNSEIYRLSFRPEGEFCFASLVLGDANTGFEALLGIRWPASVKDVKEHAIELLNVLAPHIRQALKITKRLREAREAAMASQSVVELYGLPVLLVSKHGVVKHMTSEAERFLNSGGGVFIRDGYLVAETFLQNAKLQAFVQRAFSSAESDSQHQRVLASGTRTTARSKLSKAKHRISDNMMILESPGENPPVRLFMYPLPHIEDSEVGRAALVFVFDPNSVPLSRAHLLRDCYRLTPKECTLIDMLVGGRNVKEIGDLLNLREATVRFHLRQAFRKTGTRSQSDLIRLAMGLPCLEASHLEGLRFATKVIVETGTGVGDGGAMTSERLRRMQEKIASNPMLSAAKFLKAM